MQSKLNFLKIRKLVQRENAARYILISLLSSIATVFIVRGFLVLTDYPQIGGGTIHIAHVLWGGLILYIAAILQLIYISPRLHELGAVLSGVGVGLFIDEVGKFITTQYDYFYPAAAPIMYVFFLLVLILVIMVNRPDEMDGRSELVHALEIVREQLYRPLDAKERERFEADVGKVMESDPDALHVNLARHLLEFVQADTRTLPVGRPAWWINLQKRLNAWLTERRLRWLLGIGMFLLSLLVLKNPFQVWLERSLPGSAIVAFLDAHFGRQIAAGDAPMLFDLRLGLEVVVGVLLLLAVFLLVFDHPRQGINLAYFALLLSLAVLAMLVFYFEQFSAALTVGVQFVLLFGIMYYRRKYLESIV